MISFDQLIVNAAVSRGVTSKPLYTLGINLIIMGGKCLSLCLSVSPL